MIIYPSGKEDASYSIPNSVISIGYEAFGSCRKLTGVTIPSSVTSIEESAFMLCDSLTRVNIPNSVTSIGNGIFSLCRSLTSVNIPNSVTSIGDMAFADCYSLTSVTIPNGVTSIGDYAFSSCTSLTSVTIPNSVTSIGDYAFYCCHSLTSVTIPSSVTSIGVDTFQECINLTSVIIPNSVTSIGNYAFSDCGTLKDVYYGGTEALWKAVTIGEENDALLRATIHYNSAIPATPQQPITFSDVPSGQWYSEAVAWAVCQGITNGTGSTTFSPNKTCTNAEIITFLYRANNTPKVSTTLPFTPKNAWATDALKWAYSKGVIGADFDEQAPCTRYTTVEYFWKAFDRPNAQTSTNFSDISNYNDIPIAWAVQNGITNGTSATTFSPDTTCNRAMIVTLLQRAYGK